VSLASAPDVQRVLDELAAAGRDATALVAGLDDEQVNWRPAAERWSVAQCLDHLSVTNAQYLSALEDTLAWARERGFERGGPLDAGSFGGLYLRALEPPPRLRVAAPRSIRPAPRRSRDEALAGFVDSLRRLAELLRGNADVDLNVRFRFPFVPLLRFRAGAGFRMVAAHARRHLWQARQVRRAPGFPAR
jgi:DinB superfamily